MSHATSGLISCPTFQDQLFQHFTSCDQSVKSAFHETSLVEFLASPLNTNNVLLNQISTGRGKRRDVELIYTPRILTQEVSRTPEKVCVSNNESGMLSESYTIQDVGLQYDEKFDLLTLRDICEDNELYFAGRIQAMMNVALRTMDVDLVADLAACTGAFGRDEENVAAQVKTIATKLAGGAPDPEYLEDLNFAASNAGYCDIPYIFGYNESWRAFRRHETGCCANSGLNIGELRTEWPSVFIPNSNIPETFSANHLVSLDRGAVQLIYWNEFMGANGINVIDDESFKQMVIFEPKTGIPFDFTLKNDCGDISVSIKLAYQAVCMPTDMYSVGDRFEGVTGVNEYVISNP